MVCWFEKIRYFGNQTEMSSTGANVTLVCRDRPRPGAETALRP